MTLSRQHHGPEPRRPMAGRRALLCLLGALCLSLLSACSTAKSIRRVRAAPTREGLSLYVAADVSTVGRELPALLRPLHYRDIAVQPREGGALQVVAATSSTWQRLGHGVRVIAEP